MSEAWTPLSLGYTQDYCQDPFWLSEYQALKDVVQSGSQKEREKTQKNKNGDRVPWNSWKMAEAEGTKNTYKEFCPE